MPVAQRAMILRMAAANYPKNEARKLLEETADVLEAQAAAYNALFAAALAGIQEGDWTAVRKHVALIETQRKWSKEEKSGAA